MTAVFRRLDLAGHFRLGTGAHFGPIDGGFTREFLEQGQAEHGNAQGRERMGFAQGAGGQVNRIGLTQRGGLASTHQTQPFVDTQDDNDADEHEERRR